MPTQIQLRRGTTSEHSSFTGAAGEVTVDTTKKALVVHDGSTAGGIPVARDSTVVHTTGAETVAGVKTLSSNPVLDAGTANGVAYLNGSKVLTTGSDLVYNATGLGIGTTPGTTLDVYKATGNAIVRAWAASGTPRFDIRSATRYYSISIQSDNLTFFDESDGSTRMTLLANGNYGIGTSSPNRKLEVGGTSNALMGFNSTSNRRYTIGSDANGFGVYDDTAGAYRTIIDSSGNLLVGTASTTAPGCVLAAVGRVAGTVSAVGTACFQAWNQATSGDNLFKQFYTEGGGGTLRGSIDYNRAGGLVRYNTTSDYRAKDIIGPVQNPGATIDALTVYEGKMKGATQSRPMLVAHEAQEHAPYAVSGVKDEVNEDGTPKFQQMDVSSLVPLLLAEIQSLRARVAQLEQGA